jgi:transglutaminase/protease-like cytokinesis protein 3
VYVKNSRSVPSFSNATLGGTASAFVVNASTGAVTVPGGTPAGTYQVRVRAHDSGDANFAAGDAFATYSIRVERSWSFSVTSPPSQTYAGRALEPRPTVKDGTYVLREGTDYTLTYSNNVNVGVATVVVTGRGNYAGSESIWFIIRDAPHVSYRTHVQRVGWQRYVSDGAMSGTSGKSYRLEGINVKFSDKAGLGGGIQYRTHVQRIGWQGWRKDGAMAGTKGKSYRLEAIEIKLYGDMANHYDVYYRVHCQRFGWMGWAKNGQRSGSAGYGRRLEGIQIVLVPKGQPGPGRTLRGITQRFSAPFKQRGKK